MANIGTSIKDWSTTPASNQPDTGDSASIAGDLQAIQAGIRDIYSQATLASAGTVNLGANDAGQLTITGTITITAFGTVSAGIVKRVTFSGILTLTHSGTALILPSGANITTAAGDTAEFESLGSGNWRCNRYQRASGSALVAEDVLSGATFTGNIIVPDEAYDATAWNGVLEVPTKNSVRDEMESVKSSIPESPVFTETFTSSNQTITSGGLLTVAHGLSVNPFMVFFYLVNTTAENGYSIGDKLLVSSNGDDTATARAVSIGWDATNINVRYGSQTVSLFVTVNKSNGNRIALTNANWALVVKAIA